MYVKYTPVWGVRKFAPPRTYWLRQLSPPDFWTLPDKAWEEVLVIVNEFICQ
jgi:hypothetical protein